MYTRKCLSIGTPKIINFPFVSNGKLMVFRCPNTQAHCNEAVLYLNFGTPENNEFSIWDKWKNLLSLGVPILKHIRVILAHYIKGQEYLQKCVRVNGTQFRRYNFVIFIFASPFNGG